MFEKLLSQSSETDWLLRRVPPQAWMPPMQLQGVDQVSKHLVFFSTWDKIYLFFIVWPTVWESTVHHEQWRHDKLKGPGLLWWSHGAACSHVGGQEGRRAVGARSQAGLWSPRPTLHPGNSVLQLYLLKVYNLDQGHQLGTKDSSTWTSGRCFTDKHYHSVPDPHRLTATS